MHHSMVSFAHLYVCWIHSHCCMQFQIIPSHCFIVFYLRDTPQCIHSTIGGHLGSFQVLDEWGSCTHCRTCLWRTSVSSFGGCPLGGRLLGPGVCTSSAQYMPPHGVTKRWCRNTSPVGTLRVTAFTLNCFHVSYPGGYMAVPQSGVTSGRVLTFMFSGPLNILFHVESK